MSDLTRRRFILSASAALTAKLAKAHGTLAPLTAGQVVDRIRQQVGVPWRAQTVDTLRPPFPANSQIVGGDESTPVHGIATTMMATLDVVQRAAAAGKNMIVTHETPFTSTRITQTTSRTTPRSSTSWNSYAGTTCQFFISTTSGMPASRTELRPG